MRPDRVTALLQAGRIVVLDTGSGMTPAAGATSDYPEQIHDAGFLYHGGVVRVKRGEAEDRDLDLALAAIPDPDDPQLVRHDGQPVEWGRLEVYTAHDLEDNEVLWVFWRLPIRDESWESEE